MADNDPLDDLPRQRLCDLIAQYGPELCNDPTRVETLLRNLCGEHRREVFALTSALRAGLVDDIRQALEGGKGGQLLTTIVQRMHSTLSVSEEICQWTVAAWSQALGEKKGGPAEQSARESTAAEPASLPPPSAEHRRIAAAQFDRANQAVAGGNYDYGIQLLMTCCKLDPANLIYRQALRRTEKAKFKNNMAGSKMALLTTGPARARLKAAKHARDFLRVLELGEELLTRNPWDTGVQLDMAEAAEGLGQPDLAIWILLQARQKDPNDAHVNRALARLYEKRGNFTQAISLWELVCKADPKDFEARHKAKDLAASHTIIRGEYDQVINPQDRARAAELEKTPAPAAAKPSPAADRLARETAPLLTRLEADPTNANVYLQLAAVYRRAGDLDRAREILEKGVGPCGNHFQMMLELTELQLEPFRRDLTLTEEKLRTRPNDEELRKIRIRLLKEINARELELFRQKADRYPTELSHRLELGVRLLRAGQFDEAIRELQTARTDTRHQWRALMYLGHCFKSRNNWRLAQRNFEEALKNLPAAEETLRKEILFQLASGCAGAGDLTAALDLGHELANLDFAYRDIGRLLDEWQAKVEQA